MVQMAIWLKHFLVHLGVSDNVINPTQVNCDGQAIIVYTKDSKYYEKTKHVDIKFNFVKNMVAHKEVNMKYISTQKIIGDPFTKPISRNVFISHVRSLELRRYWCTNI